MIEIKIPATSANIGPGFDALGLALNLYNTYIFSEITEGLEIIGFEEEFSCESNLVWTSMLKTFNKIGYLPKGVRIESNSNIPISRGLGSSATCILSGVLGANSLAGDPLNKDEIFRLAVEIEGHPDNIAPALFGGLVTSIMEDGFVYYNHINIENGIKFVALVPDFILSTKDAREVLPSQIPYKDGVYNVGRTAMVLSALSNGRFDLLKYGLKDKLHQPYRGRLIKGFDEIFDKSTDLGALGVYLSGAGPTIMAIVEEKNESFGKKIKEYLDSQGYNWDVKELSLDLVGATIGKL